jgi:hypothetical protein
VGFSHESLPLSYLDYLLGSGNAKAVKSALAVIKKRTGSGTSRALFHAIMKTIDDVIDRELTTAQL